jgi:hypothetical protein
MLLYPCNYLTRSRKITPEPLFGLAHDAHPVYCRSASVFRRDGAQLTSCRRFGEPALTKHKHIPVLLPLFLRLFLCCRKVDTFPCSAPVRDAIQLFEWLANQHDLPPLGYVSQRCQPNFDLRLLQGLIDSLAIMKSYLVQRGSCADLEICCGVMQGVVDESVAIIVPQPWGTAPYWELFNGEISKRVHKTYG